MKIIIPKGFQHSCNHYTYHLSKVGTFGEWLFENQRIVRQDGTMAERIQRWLIDNDNFCTTEVRKSLKQYFVDKTPSFDIDRAVEFINLTFLAETVAGRSLYFSISGMLFRAIELFYQSTNNFLFTLAISPETKKAMYGLSIAAFFVLNSYLGYDVVDTSYNFILPVLLDIILSFGWSNYFKQIQTLSGTKNFELKDFCFRNFQSFLVRLVPIVLHLLISYPSILKSYPGSISICEISLGEFFVTNFVHAHSHRAYFFSILTEAAAVSLGKTVFDLVYIFTLVMVSKALSKDVDLRDPMGWLFSKSRNQVSSITKTQEEMSQIDFSEKHKKKFPPHRRKTAAEQNKAPSSEEVPASSGESSGGVKWIYPGKDGKENVKRESKNKDPIDDVQGDKKKDSKYGVKKTGDNPSKKPISRVSIKVGSSVLTFQQLFYPSHNKETWGVIITNSVEKQTLTLYRNGLANGYIGGGTISPLTGFGGKLFEIRPGTDSRLIGKVHDGDHYFTLQSYMRMEEALQFSRELERYGIDEKVSLIVFSKEAKKHNDINRVAGSL